jgi:hypothetical protein
VVWHKPMSELPLAISTLLVAAACRPVSPPTGTFTYTARFGPEPRTSVAVVGGTIVISVFAADRSLTTTISRYDAKTLVLRSATEHGSCCGAQWDSSVSWRGDGSYLINSSQHVPASNQRNPVVLSDIQRLPAKKMPVIINDLWLVPWIYHATHVPTVERVFLPSLSSTHTMSEVLYVAEVANETRPMGVAPTDEALKLVGESGDAIILWYSPCSFVLDAIERRLSLVLREGQ